MKKSPSLFAFITAIIIFSIFASGPSSGKTEKDSVYLVTVDDYIINPVVEEYISNAIRLAQRDGQCLIIQLDTPGGLLASTRKIVKEIMGSEVPVVVYISPSGARAGSAGVFITISSHIAAMAPSTNIGAAHPVQMGGSRRSISDVIKEIVRAFKKTDEGKREKRRPIQPPKEEKDIMSEKIMSDTLAWVTAIAQTRKRNVSWARSAVLESASATETEALKKGVVDLIADDINSLLTKIDGKRIKINDKIFKLETKDTRIVKIDLDKRQQFLNVITNPTIAYILMILGFYGLLFEFTHPGVGFPGIAGTICIILGFYSLHTLPTNYAGVGLIILAFILFIAEMRVASFGLLTLGGIVSMVLGSVILIDSPHTFMKVSLRVILPVVIATAAISTFLAATVIKTHRRRVKSGAEGLIGEQGKVIRRLKPKGKVFIHGEVWNAVSEQPVNKGETIEVVKVEGMKLIVKKIKQGGIK